MNGKNFRSGWEVAFLYEIFQREKHPPGIDRFDSYAVFGMERITKYFQLMRGLCISPFGHCFYKDEIFFAAIPLQD